MQESSLLQMLFLTECEADIIRGTVSGVVYQRSQFSGVSDGAGNPSDRFAARLANGPRNTECMQAALEALSGVNNIGGYTSFRALYTVDVNNYSDFVIIGDHIFH